MIHRPKPSVRSVLGLAFLLTAAGACDRFSQHDREIGDNSVLQALNAASDQRKLERSVQLQLQRETINRDLTGVVFEMTGRAVYLLSPESNHAWILESDGTTFSLKNDDFLTLPDGSLRVREEKIEAVQAALKISPPELPSLDAQREAITQHVFPLLLNRTRGNLYLHPPSAGKQGWSVIGKGHAFVLTLDDMELSEDGFLIIKPATIQKIKEQTQSPDHVDSMPVEAESPSLRI